MFSIIIRSFKSDTRYKVSLIVVLLLICCHFSNQQTTPVWTRGYNNARTGANLNEKILSTSNVKASDFGKLFSRTVQGHIYAQVLYIPNLTMEATNRTHNVIFVATQANNVYAFDADDAATSTPLWQRNLGTPYPISDNLVGRNCGTFRDIAIEIGITGTPVIDQESGTLFVVTLNKVSSGPVVLKYYLHAIDITSGQSRPNSPVEIKGRVAGTGIGSSNGVLEFLPTTHLQRLSLALHNGIVYVGFAGYCFTPPYHGWLFGYSSSTLEQKFVFCSTPNGDGGGIWQGGSPISADDKYIYFGVANGLYDGNTNWGDSFLKVDPTNVAPSDASYPNVLMNITDSFTPYNQRIMYEADLDATTTAPMLIPNTNLIIGCSKVGRCYLLDKNNMGGYQRNTNNIIQDFKPVPGAPEAFGFGIHSTPVAWNSETNGTLIYTWPASSTLRAMHLKVVGTTGSFDLGQTEQSNVGSALFPGGMLTLSADGSKSGTGIVWASHSFSGNANHNVQTGILRAIDAENLNNELWNSAMNEERDRVGGFAKFNPPIVTNGKVYLATFGSQTNRESHVQVYGILSGGGEDSCDAALCEGLPCCSGQCYDPQQSQCVDGSVVPIPVEQSTNSSPVPVASSIPPLASSSIPLELPQETSSSVVSTYSLVGFLSTAILMLMFLLNMK